MGTKVGDGVGLVWVGLGWVLFFFFFYLRTLGNEITIDMWGTGVKEPWGAASIDAALLCV